MTRFANSWLVDVVDTPLTTRLSELLATEIDAVRLEMADSQHPRKSLVDEHYPIAGSPSSLEASDPYLLSTTLAAGSSADPSLPLAVRARMAEVLALQHPDPRAYCRWPLLPPAGPDLFGRPAFSASKDDSDFLEVRETCVPVDVVSGSQRTY